MKLHAEGVYYADGKPAEHQEGFPTPDEGRITTMAAKILYFHSRSGDIKELTIAFDVLGSCEKAGEKAVRAAYKEGMRAYPVPFATAGGEGFSRTAAEKFGGVFVPGDEKNLHAYMRERLTACGSMALCTGSLARFGALGTLGFSAGEEALTEQLIERTYDIEKPEVALVYVVGELKADVTAADAAHAFCEAVRGGFVSGRILEFAGPGIEKLPMEFRMELDERLFDTGAVSSVWETDGSVQAYYEALGREEAFEALHPEKTPYYDRWMELDLSELAAGAGVEACFAYKGALDPKGVYEGFPFAKPETPLELDAGEQD